MADVKISDILDARIAREIDEGGKLGLDWLTEDQARELLGEVLSDLTRLTVALGLLYPDDEAQGRGTIDRAIAILERLSHT